VEAVDAIEAMMRLVEAGVKNVVQDSRAEAKWMVVHEDDDRVVVVLRVDAEFTEDEVRRMVLASRR